MQLPEVLILNDNYARTRQLTLPPYIKLAQLYLNVLLSRTIRHDRMRLTEGEYLGQDITTYGALQTSYRSFFYNTRALTFNNYPRLRSYLLTLFSSAQVRSVTFL